MTMHLSLKLTWPEGAQAEEDGLPLEGMEVELIAEELPPVARVTLLLFMAEAINRKMFQASIEESNPLSNPDLLDGVAASAARLDLVHTILHLPLTEATWTMSDFD